MTWRIVLLSLFLLAFPARGHDLWLERESDDYVLRYGHRGADLLDYPPSWIQKAYRFDATGALAALPAAETSPYRIPAAGHGCYLGISSGIWTKTPYGTEPIGRSAAKMPLRSWRSMESVKRIDRWSPELAAPLTTELEITPLNNPFTLESGDKMRLLVTFAGKPIANVPVAYDGEVRGASGVDGRVNLRVRHGGLQMIQASYSNPAPENPDIDETIWTATLNLELESQQ